MIRKTLELREGKGLDEEAKDNAIKRMFELYRKDHTFLEKVIQNETTFQKTYEPMLDRKYVRKLTEEERGIIEDNKKLIDISSVYCPDSLARNPLTLSLTLTSVFALGYTAVFGISNLIGMYSPPQEVAVLTDYLNNLKGFAYAGGFMGFIFGGIGWLDAESTLAIKKREVRADLELLDKQIRRMYGGKKK